MRIRTLKTGGFKPQRTKKRSWDVLFVMPWLIGFLLFTLIPFAFSFYISFSKFNMLGDPKWIGIKNYLDSFTKDPYTVHSLVVTLKYMLVSVPLRMVFALMVAVILKNNLRFVRLFRTLYYLPSLLGGTIAIAIVWKAMFTKNGVFNSFLGILGIQGQEWIGNPSTALYVLALLPMWQFGSSMLIFLAGLNAIPRSLLDAAEVDGARSVQKFFKITLPLITPTVFFNLVMQIINAMQSFTSAYVISNGVGDPNKSTLVFVLNIYNNAFRNYKFGYAAALSWILFLIITIFTIVLFVSQKRWVHYEHDGKIAGKP